jgi:hypothetical protein
LSSFIVLKPDERIFLAAEKILSALRPKALTPGPVDLFIAAESHLSGLPVYSYEKVFKSIESTKLIAAI